MTETALVLCRNVPRSAEVESKRQNQSKTPPQNVRFRPRVDVDLRAMSGVFWGLAVVPVAAEIASAANGAPWR